MVEINSIHPKQFISFLMVQYSVVRLQSIMSQTSLVLPDDYLTSAYLCDCYLPLDMYVLCASGWITSQTWRAVWWIKIRKLCVVLQRLWGYFGTVQRSRRFVSVREEYSLIMAYGSASGGYIVFSYLRVMRVIYSPQAWILKCCSTLVVKIFKMT